MDILDGILKFDEQIIFRLRKLYNEFGYSQYKMNRFEEYELYAENKAFLPSKDILTFTDINGKLMALRPDVTLSIVKYAKDNNKLSKLYYNENIYRSDGSEFKEQMQVGLECIGYIDVNIMGEVLLLAKRSLDTLSENYKLDVSHIGYLNGLLESENLTQEQKKEVAVLLSEKNSSGITGFCTDNNLNKSFCDKISNLMSLLGTYEDVADKLREICINEDMELACDELDKLNKVMKEHGISECINIDFSIINDIGYYNGIIFQGYIRGVPDKVLSGGRYDELLYKFGKKSGAIGFAVYIDKLSPVTRSCNTLLTPGEAENKASKEILNIALPKGRLGEKAYEIFDKSGYGCPEIKEESRKLVFENKDIGIRYFWVKPSDVAKYVERGAADIGVVGKDILQETAAEVYELLDLGIGKCNISVAAAIDYKYAATAKTLKAATKFPNITKNHYRKQGWEIDIIELNGSIELAPLLGLSDVIVDIVETGKTLLENNLEPKELVMEVSARLVSNKASYKFNHEKIDKLCEKIERHGLK